MKTSNWTAVIDDVTHLPALLTALQTDNTLLQVEVVIPVGDTPNKAVVVYSVPV